MHILSIRPEKILYFYMASCIAVLIFNLFYIFFDRFQNEKFEKRRLDLTDILTGEMHLLSCGGTVSAAHQRKMRRFLAKPEKLRSFEYSMPESGEDVTDEDKKEYFRQMRPVFLGLAEVYARRDPIEKAYFARVIELFGIDRGQESGDGIIEFLNGLVIQKDVYARENALRALLSIGNKDMILAVWQKMQENEIHHSSRLLSDGLLKFTGDREELARLLFAHMEEFDCRLALPILQFVRILGADFRKEILRIVKSDRADKELRLEGIRYFRKCPYEPAKEVLKNLVIYRDHVDWEYSAVAATSLQAYPGPDTEICLKDGLKAYNWYVRLNCAEALISGLQIPQIRLYDVYNGTDRYAIEILKYASDRYADGENNYV